MRLLLLGTAGCHLCEEAELILATYYRQHSNLSIELVDIAEHIEWQAEYATRIPVLFHPATQSDLGWPFTLADADYFITGLQK